MMWHGRMAQRLVGADGTLGNGSSFNASQRLPSSNVSFKRKISDTGWRKGDAEAVDVKCAVGKKLGGRMHVQKRDIFIFC